MPGPDLFRTRRLRVRLYDAAAQRRELAADAEVKRFSGWPDSEQEVFAEAVAAMRGRSLHDGGWFNLAASLDGGDYAGDHAVRIEGAAATLGIALLPTMRGRGIAQEIIAGSMAWLRTEGVTGFRAEIDPDNAASLATFKRAGFARVRLDSDEAGPFWVLEAQEPRCSGLSAPPMTSARGPR